MPDDIEPISEEELFKQQFLQQLTSEGGNAGLPDAAPSAGSAGNPPVANLPKPLAALANGGMPAASASVIPAVNSVPSAPSESAPDEALAAGEAKAEEKTAETESEAKNAEDAKIAAERQKKLEETDLIEEAPDTVMVKIPYPETNYVEWKGIFEIRQELEELDDGRKDGKEGAEGEMAGEEEEEEFTVMTDKEFQAQLLAQQMPTLMKFFRPELLNRFDEIIFFSPLRKKELIQIVDVMLRETREMLNEKNLQLKLADAARDFLAEKGYNPAFGARPLRRAIQEHLEDPLSDLLIMGKFKSGDIIYVDIDGKKLKFTKDVGSGNVEDMFDQLDNSLQKNDGQANGAGKANQNGQPNAKNPQEELVNVKDPFAEIYGDEVNFNAPETQNSVNPAPQVSQQNPNAAGSADNSTGVAPAANVQSNTNPQTNQTAAQAVTNGVTDLNASPSPFAAETQAPTEAMAGANGATPSPKKGLFGKMFAK